MSKTKIKLLGVAVAAVMTLALVGCQSGRPVKGYVTNRNEVNRTIEIDGQLINVPRNIHMTKAGTPIALQDINIGDKVDARVSEGTNTPPDANAITVLYSGSGNTGKAPRK
jgi:hypothetical protein